MKNSVLTLSLALVCLCAFGQPKKLIDFKEFPGLATANSGFFSTAREFDSKLYFTAKDGPHGYELWRSDGTAQGTTLVKDVNPGLTSSYATHLMVFEDKLFFTAQTRDSNSEHVALWSTDGSEVNTKEIKNSSAVFAYEYPQVGLNGIFYFAGFSEENGIEIWRTDGGDNTGLLKEIMPGPGSPLSSGSSMKATPNYVFFDANDGVNGRELWRTDGTEEGTVLVKDINPLGSSIDGTMQFISIGDEVYFVADDGIHGSQLWKSDGTAGGTIPLTDSDIRGPLVAEIDGKIFMIGATDEGSGILVTDRTFGTETVIKDDDGNSINVENALFIKFNDALYFQTQSHGFWKTDGTIATLLPTVGSFTFNLGMKYAIVNNFIWISNGQKQLWKSDGNTLELAATTQKSFTMFSAGSNIFAFMNTDDVGLEPRIYNQESNEFVLLKDINQNLVESPKDLTPSGDKLFFSANDVIHGRELWTSDGTVDGTKIVSDTYPGGTDANKSMSLNPLGGNVLFDAYGPDGILAGKKLWISDGTEDGTQILMDVNPSTVKFGSMGGVSYFFANTTELWKTNGSVAGTVLVKDINASDLKGLVATHDKIFFMESGRNLWVSDGTESGTVLLKDLGEDSPDYFYYNGIKAGENKAYVIMTDETLLPAWVWITDGTEAGTKSVFRWDVSEDWGFNFSNICEVLDDIAYLALDAGDNGNSAGYFKFWRTDGTEEGTYQIKSAGSDMQVYRATAVGSTLYASASTSKHNFELWETNGTDPGTTLIQEIQPGDLSSYPTFFTSHLGNIYFLATTLERADELWKMTPGKEVVPISEIGPGGESSLLSQMVSYGSNLGILRTNGEVWVFNPAQQITFEEISDKKSTEEPFVLVASASSGLPVTYEVVSGPASIESGTLTVTGPGDVTVRASQEGNNDYNPATPVEQTFTVFEETVNGLEDKLNETISVWPNPATNILVITTSSVINSASFHDILGREVISTSIDQNGVNIDVAHLPRGMYLLKLKDANNRIFIRKIILK